jgi:hypothetical protein
MKDYDAIFRRIEQQAHKTPDSRDDAIYAICAIHKVLDEWDAAYPVKTYAQDFFCKYPNAPYRTICGTKIPAGIGLASLGLDHPNYCTDEQEVADAWNRPMKEESE